MATVPTPRTWITGKVIGATQLNTHVRDATNFLLAPPRAWNFLGVNQTIATGGTYADLGLDSRCEDTDGMISAAPAQAGKIVIQTAGRWRINWSVRFAAAAAGAKNGAGLNKNGTSIKRVIENTINTSNQVSVQDVTYATLAIGDVLTLEAMQTTGANLDVIGSALDASPTPGQYVTFMQARYLGT